MDQLDYKAAKREYEASVQRLRGTYRKPGNGETLRRVSNGVRRQVVKFTNGRVSFGPQVRARSRVSAPTAE